jgi:hypothetical protein
VHIPHIVSLLPTKFHEILFSSFRGIALTSCFSSIFREISKLKLNKFPKYTTIKYGIECVAVHVKSPQIFVINIYRPPDLPVKYFCDVLNCLLLKLLHIYRNICHIMVAVINWHYTSLLSIQMSSVNMI